MTDDGSREDLRDLAQGYHEPPEIPREEMWTEIRRSLDVVAVEEDSAGRRFPPALKRWGWAAAALLVLAVGLGRWTGPAPEPGSVAAESHDAPGAPTPGRNAPLFRVAYQHLSGTESFLAGVEADARRGELDPAVAAWSRQLLIQTRLLLDSPAARDPEMGPLLHDLELILFQVNRAVEAQREGDDRAREELELLRRGMGGSDLKLRIDAVLPPSTGMIGT